MNAATVIARMQDMASTTKDDRLANVLSALVSRLSHQGALFEKPLTKTEVRLIMKFVEV